ncbi:hypothetical protein [Teichococcus aestuarii]|uniref:hypothetical protein n=1 Tax=Teichococcus aestuarii TaxID=568898 RepID=UPI003619442E
MALTFAVLGRRRRCCSCGSPPASRAPHSPSSPRGAAASPGRPHDPGSADHRHPPDGRRPAALLIQGGRIAGLGPEVTAPPGVPVEAGGGALLIPGLVEAHTHLDKSLLGMGWRPHRPARR